VLECVQLEDSNVNSNVMSPRSWFLSLERDGMGLVDREAAEAAMEAGQNPE
jgi:hypothetical protein